MIGRSRHGAPEPVEQSSSTVPIQKKETPHPSRSPRNGCTQMIRGGLPNVRKTQDRGRASVFRANDATFQAVSNGRQACYGDQRGDMTDTSGRPRKRST